MKPIESIFEYVSRIKDLRIAIMDGELDLRGNYFEDYTGEAIEKTF